MANFKCSCSCTDKQTPSPAREFKPMQYRRLFPIVAPLRFPFQFGACRDEDDHYYKNKKNSKSKNKNTKTQTRQEDEREEEEE